MKKSYKLASLLLTASVIFASLFCWFAVGPRRFTSELWKESAHRDFSSSGHPRVRMADDILNRRLLLGMSKAEVVATLGQPEVPGARTFEYRIGSYRRTTFLFTAAAKIATLEITFDEHSLASGLTLYDEDGLIRTVK